MTPTSYQRLDDYAVADQSERYSSSSALDTFLEHPPRRVDREVDRRHILQPVERNLHSRRLAQLVFRRCSIVEGVEFPVFGLPSW